jgi:hypothetical protein
MSGCNLMAAKNIRVAVWTGRIKNFACVGVFGIWYSAY